MGQGQSLATPADPLVQRQSPCRATSDGKPRQTHAGRRWDNLERPGEEGTGHARARATRAITPNRCGACTSRRSNGKTRPLGIPTMHDRAMQALYLLALDPIAETTGDPNSYGFRPERSTADAIEQCFNAAVSNRIGQMDSRRRHQGVLRPDQSRLAAGPHPDGEGHPPEMAEGRVHGAATSSIRPRRARRRVASSRRCWPT